MSQKYPGGFITKSPVAPASGVASGMWTLDQAMQLKKQGIWPPTVPGAPTIGTATQTGSTTATVVYTQPASNGSSTITSYTATSSPAGGTGTLSQAGSGTITVTGLTGNTSYTFTVTATNAIGTSAASAASNSITTALGIGNAYQGGFYAGQIGVAGTATHNLVIAPVSSGQFNGFWKTVNNPTTGTDSVIDGPANTAAMIAAGAAAHPCGQFCDNATIGGYTDWYMHAQNEFEVIYYNLKPTATSNNTASGINLNAVPARATPYTAGTPTQTSASAFQYPSGAQALELSKYWASTQNAAYASANFQYAFNGTQGSAFKRSYYFVRAIRRVAV